MSLSVVLLGLLTATVVACTGGDESADGDAQGDGSGGQADSSGADARGQALERGEFAAAHRAAVERYADALEDVQNAGIDAVTADPVGAHKVYDALREATEVALAEFAALTPPRDVAAEYERLVELLQEQVEVLREAVTASRERDDRTLESHLERYAELLATWRTAYGALTDLSEGA